MTERNDWDTNRLSFLLLPTPRHLKIESLPGQTVSSIEPFMAGRLECFLLFSYSIINLWILDLLEAHQQWIEEWKDKALPTELVTARL